MSKKEYPAKLTTGYYRVREVWEDEASQFGAYRLLANAKAKCDENPGSRVFDNDGNVIYPEEAVPDTGADESEEKAVVDDIPEDKPETTTPVEDTPAEKEAESHIRKLEEIYEKLKVMYQPEGIGINYCHCTAQGAELEFLGGITLEEKLDTLLEAGKTEELEALLFSYIEKIRRIHEKEPFEKTEDFGCKLLHFSALPFDERSLLHVHDRETGDVRLNTERYNLLEIMISGQNRPGERHGNKYISTSPGDRMKLVYFTDKHNEFGRKLEIHMEDKICGIETVSHMQFYNGVQAVRCWTDVKNVGTEPQGLEYVSSFALTGIETSVTLGTHLAVI